MLTATQTAVGVAPRPDSPPRKFCEKRGSETEGLGPSAGVQNNRVDGINLMLVRRLGFREVHSWDSVQKNGLTVVERS